MKMSNIFEQDSSQAATGANALRQTMGSKTGGTMVSKALDKLSQGGVLSPNLAKSLGPYAEALEIILSNPQFRAKFMQMMKQVQSAKKKEEPAQEPAPQAMQGQQESVTEDQDSVDAVAGAITRRIMMQHVDLLSKYGPVKVMAAIDDVADFAGGDGLDEIGSSDVSIWTKQVIQDLESGHYDHVEEAEQIDEILPAVGAAVGRAAFSGASAITRGIAGGVGRLAGMAAQSALDDNDEDPTDAASTGDEVDTVTLDVPLLLRMMEYAREDAQEDMDLHDVAERMIAMSKNGPLSMDDYDNIVGSVEGDIDEEQLDELSPQTKASYMKKAGAEINKHWDNSKKDARSAYKYYGRKNTMKKIANDEKLDELSPQTLGSYVSKSVKDEKERRERGIRVRDELRKATGKNFGTPLDRKLYSPTASRAAGQRRAIDKLTGKSKVPAAESYYAPGPETMPGAVGPQEDTNVSFNQTKRMGDASVTVSANAKDMEELHRVLKLAGIEVEKSEPSVADAAVALAPHAHADERAEGEPCPQCGMIDCDCPPGECDCGSEEPEVTVKPLDLKYSTDKTALINALRDKLKRL